MRVTARAKINWVLDITGQRPDGYHLMDMLMQPITLADTLHLTEADDIMLSVTAAPEIASDLLPPGESNLVWRAAALLKSYTGVNRGVHISLEKNIPMGAGLGGGSADAAAALVGLNRLWDLSLSPEVLASLALKLGADVPFFLSGRLSRVQGIGEDVRVVSKGPKWNAVIIQPCPGLSTREMFERFSESEGIARPDVESLEQILAQEDLAVLPIHPVNVLEIVSCALQPEIGQAAGFLVRNGAVCAQMSGSGSAVFGIFQSAKDAESAAQAARERWSTVCVCQTCDEALLLH